MQFRFGLIGNPSQDRSNWAQSRVVWAQPIYWLLQRGCDSNINLMPNLLIHQLDLKSNWDKEQNPIRSGPINSGRVGSNQPNRGDQVICEPDSGSNAYPSNIELLRVQMPTKALLSACEQTIACNRVKLWSSKVSKGYGKKMLIAGTTKETRLPYGLQLCSHQPAQKEIDHFLAAKPLSYPCLVQSFLWSCVAGNNCSLQEKSLFRPRFLGATVLILVVRKTMLSLIC